ncbi:MAG TPA: DUF6655 family protein [Pirellulales bacterium]|jgi:hypothetical protein|nr:DUF6655 family protein [Pirellulales bacterium]
MRWSVGGLIWLTCCVASAGCGTTKWSDTARTATEQLLISTAVDQSIERIDFSPLAGRNVYLDTQFMEGIVDKNYVISTMRQHMLAQNCILNSDRETADYTVEARAGAVGTNHHDVLLGVPALVLPTGALTGVPSAIPEIPFAKSTDQKGIAKIACFAYDNHTGQAVWQSGVFPVVCNAKDTWILGSGPFQRGTIYDGTRFAGSRLMFSQRKRNSDPPPPPLSVAQTKYFNDLPFVAGPLPKRAAAAGVAAAPAKPGATPAPAPPGAAMTGTSQGLGTLGTVVPAQATAPAVSNGTSSGLPSGSVVRIPAIGEAPRPAAK